MNGVIVPLMQAILATTEVELSLISAAIRDRAFDKALWLKERYRFDVTHLYERLNEALAQTSELRSRMRKGETEARGPTAYASWTFEHHRVAPPDRRPLADGAARR